MNNIYPLLLFLILILSSCSDNSDDCNESNWEGNYNGFIDCNLSGPQSDSIIARQDFSFIIFSREADRIVFDDITLDIDPVLCHVGYSETETSVSGNAIRTVNLTLTDKTMTYENIFDARKREFTPFLFTCKGVLEKD